MKRAVLLSLVVALLFSTLLLAYAYGEVDKTSTVIRVIDGDTFDISTGERIRLADVDAPEYYESGYSQATDYLSSLIDGKTVYLDVDDVYTYDYSGTGDRLVCVAYVDYDSTHLMNVNKALVDEGYAIISNYYNESSPYSWSLLILNETSEQTQSPSPSSALDHGSDSLDYVSIGVSVFAVLFVIVVFVMISKMGNAKDKTGLANNEKPSGVKPKFYCRYCGAENKNDAVFCESCGKNLK